MGIDIKLYTYYGIRCDWNDDFYDAYDEVESQLIKEFGYKGPYPSERNINLLLDGMCGEYIIFGIELYDSGNMRFWDNINNFEEINISNLKNSENEYREKFKKIYPNHYHLIEDKPFVLMNIIHYY